MRRLFLVIMLLAGLQNVDAQTINSWKAQDIGKRAASGDTTYVFNFWATWCVPCVEELPEFDLLAERYKNQPVKFIMVSLDFKESYPGKLAMFVQRKRMQQEVAWLNETNPNLYIPKIEDSWQGSIPATLIIRPGRMRRFVEGQITAAQLTKIIDGAADDQ